MGFCIIMIGVYSLTSLALALGGAAVQENDYIETI